MVALEEDDASVSADGPSASAGSDHAAEADATHEVTHKMVRSDSPGGTSYHPVPVTPDVLNDPSEPPPNVPRSYESTDRPSESPVMAYPVQQGFFPMQPGFPHHGCWMDGNGVVWQLVGTDKAGQPVHVAQPGQWGWQQQSWAAETASWSQHPEAEAYYARQSPERPRRMKNQRRARSHSNERSSAREAMARGRTIEVLEPFEVQNEGEDKIMVKKGMFGVVSRVDKDGDALIDFYRKGQSGQTFGVWVFKREYSKLDVKAARRAAEATEWPRLGADSAARFPLPGSIWGCNEARGTGSQQRLRTPPPPSEMQPNDQAVPTAVTPQPQVQPQSSASQPDITKRPDVLSMLAKLNGKCNAEVQCDLLPSTERKPTSNARWCDLNEPTICKHCGMSSDAPTESFRSKPLTLASLQSKASKVLPEVPSMPVFSEWGPANDWAWDLKHQKQTDDTDARTESSQNDAVPNTPNMEESRSRHLVLPPAPLVPAPRPPKKMHEVGTAPLVPPPLPPKMDEVELDLPCPATPTTSAGPSPEPSPYTISNNVRGFGLSETVRPIELPVSTISCAEQLQQQLLRLQKRLRKAKCLEECIDTLNDDQKRKLCRLGSSKCLQAKVELLEALITQARDGLEMSEDESSEECSLPLPRTHSAPPAPVKKEPAKPQAARAQKTTPSKPANEAKHNRSKDQPVTTQSVAPVPPTAKKKKDGQVSTSTSSQAAKRKAEHPRSPPSRSYYMPFLVVAAIIALCAAAMFFKPFEHLRVSELVKHPRVTEMVEQLRRVPEAIGQLHLQMQQVPQRRSRTPAGASNAWDALKPSFENSRLGSQQIATLIQSQQVAAARGFAFGRQAHKNVKKVRRRLMYIKEARARRAARDAAASEKSLVDTADAQAPPRPQIYSEEDLYRWLVSQDPSRREQLYWQWYEEQKQLQQQQKLHDQMTANEAQMTANEAQQDAGENDPLDDASLPAPHIPDGSSPDSSE